MEGFAHLQILQKEKRSDTVYGWVWLAYASLSPMNTVFLKHRFQAGHRPCQSLLFPLCKRSRPPHEKLQTQTNAILAGHYSQEKNTKTNTSRREDAGRSTATASAPPKGADALLVYSVKTGSSTFR